MGGTLSRNLKPPLWQASKHYPVAGKLAGELNLAVWWSTLVEAKLKFTNISYLHIYTYGDPSLNQM